MPDQGPSRLNDIALHQMKRQTPDPNITFIGGLVETEVAMQDGERSFVPQLGLWIARHSVLPDQPQVRAVSLVDPATSENALLNALVEAIIPSTNPNLAPMMPGRIEVADAATAQQLRQALTGLRVEIAVAQDMTIIDSLATNLASDLRRQLAPIPAWDAPAEVIRDLAATAANLYRRDPWQAMGDTPPVAITINRYGVDTLWLSLTFGNEHAEGVIAYLSEADYHLAGKVGFLMERLEEAGGEVINLDLPAEDVAVVERAIHAPEHSLGEAISLFFEPAEELNETTLREVRQLKLPTAARNAIPIFTRVSSTADPRRPNENEARALRLALDAFNLFFVRHRERIEDEAWHFGPIASTMQVKVGGEKIPVKVQLASLAPTLSPTLRHAVLKLRVILEQDPTIWREIEVEASQPLTELEDTIQESFGWPVRIGSFLPRDPYDGEETYETRLVEDIITSDNAPVGLLVNQPRDFAHFMFDIKGKGLSHRLRLLSIEKKDESAEYPRVVRAHGETPPIYSPEEYEIDEDDDEIEFEFDDGDDDE